MSTQKYKHLKFEDRYVIQEFLDFGYSFTAIANRIGKDRRTVSKEIYNHRFLKSGSNKLKLDCPDTNKPRMYVTIASAKHPVIKTNIYNANVAQNEYEKTLRKERSRLHISNESFAAINDTIAPLMIHKHNSVNHVYAAHP